MTIVTFYKKNFKGYTKIYKVKLHGHSGYAESGSDIVCSAISSSLEFFINTLNIEFGIEKDTKILIKEEPPEIIFDFSKFYLEEPAQQNEYAILKISLGFLTHIKNIEADFPQYVKIKQITEV